MKHIMITSASLAFIGACGDPNSECDVQPEEEIETQFRADVTAELERIVAESESQGITFRSYNIGVGCVKSDGNCGVVDLEKIYHEAYLAAMARASVDLCKKDGLVYEDQCILAQPKRVLYTNELNDPVCVAVADINHWLK